MSIKARIMDDIKSSMKAKQKDITGTLRMLTAAIKQVEVDERKTVEDQDILNIIAKMIKQRKDAAEQYLQADRSDLESQERAEITVLEQYLPEQLSEQAVKEIITAIIEQSGASGMQDMGKVMGLVKAQIAGQADMSVVSGLVKSLLT